MTMARDPMENILAELAGGPAQARMSPEEREARARAALAVRLGTQMRLGRALTDMELDAALAQHNAQRAAQLIGGGRESRRMIVEDVGNVGLTQIETLRKDDAPIDEVDKYLLDKYDAMQDSGGDQFRTFQAMQEAERVRDLAAQSQGYTPATATNAILGNQVPVKPGDLIEVLNWQGKDAEARSCILTIRPAIVLPITQLPVAQIRPMAQIQWGAMGFLFNAQIDVGLGIQLAIGAASVRVQVGQDALDTGATATALPMTASLSFGNIERTGITLLRSVYLNADANLGSGASSVTVPAFAKNVVFWRGGPSADYGFTIAARDSAGNQIYRQVVAADTYMTVPMPLSADIAQIIITNAAGGGAVNYGRVMFGLAL